MHQTLAHRVCAFLQLDPPTLPASADELELAAAAALLAAFWWARTFCLYAFTNAGVGAPDELLSCVVFDAAGVAETLLRTTWPRDDAEACVMPVLHDDAACAAGDAMLIIAVFTDDAARAAGEAMSNVAVSRDDAACAAGTLLPWDGADALTEALRFAAGVLLLLDAPLRFAPMPRDDAEAPPALSVANLTTASRILCRCG